VIKSSEVSKTSEVYITEVVLMKVNTAFLMLILLLVFSFWFAEAADATIPGLSINPEKISAQKNEQFSVSVNVGNVTELFGASFELQFNGDVLEATGAKPGDFLGDDVLFLNMPATGKISIAISKKGGDKPASGSGVLTTVDFKTKADGESDIRFDEAKVNLQKADGSPVSDMEKLSLGICQVKVGLESPSQPVKPSAPKLAFDPTTQQVDVGAEFSLQLQAQDVTQLFGVAIEIVYNSTLLEVSKVTAGDFLGKDVIFFSMSEGGSVNIAVSKKAGDSPADGTGTLAVIQFKAKAKGEANVSIRKETIELRQNDGSPIPDVDALTVGVAQVTVGKPSAIAISPTDYSAQIGEQFTLNVVVSNILNLFGASFELQFDSKVLEVVEAKQGDFLGDDVIFFDISGKDAHSIAITRKAGMEGVDGSGTIASVTFVAKSTGATNIAINPATMQLTDANGVNISGVEAKSAKIEVAEATEPWDVNRDGMVDILDLSMVGRYFGKADFPSEYNPDVNGDGRVDILDLVLVGKNFGKEIAPR